MRMTLFLIIALIMTTSALDTVSQLFLKNRINRLGININRFGKVFGFIFKLITSPALWLACIFSGVSLIIWLFILSKVDLNFAFSLDSMHYIFIAFASRIFLKEKVGLTRWIGTIFIVLGIFLVTLSGQTN